MVAIVVAEVNPTENSINDGHIVHDKLVFVVSIVLQEPTSREPLVSTNPPPSPCRVSYPLPCDFFFFLKIRYIHKKGCEE